MNLGERDNHLKPLRLYPKGQLFIRFDIEFPRQLGQEKKDRIVELLKTK